MDSGKIYWETLKSVPGLRVKGWNHFGRALNTACKRIEAGTLYTGSLHQMNRFTWSELDQYVRSWKEALYYLHKKQIVGEVIKCVLDFFWLFFSLSCHQFHSLHSAEFSLPDKSSWVVHCSLQSGWELSRYGKSTNSEKRVCCCNTTIANCDCNKHDQSLLQREIYELLFLSSSSVLWI